MKLLEIYRSILKFALMQADENGYISSITFEDKKEPVFIDGLRLVLPTDYHLRNFNPKEKIIFHPFTENILRGESEVIQKLKSILNIRLNYTAGIVAQYLLNLVASPQMHARLTPEQNEIITAISDADEKSVATLTNLMISGIKDNPDRVFTNVYLKRGGVFENKRYARVGIVTFPFYENVVNGKIDKLRAKDKQAYKQLFEFMFPNIEQHDSYNFGSDSAVSPYLEALLRSVAKVASRLNDLISVYRDFIDDADQLMFDSEWLEYFRDLNDLIPEIRKIPVQHGNDGELSVIEEPKAAPVSNAMVPMNYNNQVAPQQPIQPAAPEVKRTSRGLDFKSVVNSNPALAGQPNPGFPMPGMMGQQMMPPAQMQYMQDMNRMPSWAQPQQPQMNMAPWQGPAAPGFPGGPQITMVNTPNGPQPVMIVQTPQGQQMVPVMQAPNGSWVPIQQGGYYPR